MTDETTSVVTAEETTTGVEVEQQQAESQTDTGSETESQVEQNDDKPEGAPESYDFTPPEGQELDDVVIGEFSQVAKDLNLTQDQAQSVLNRMLPIMQQRTQEQMATVKEEWVKQSKADKEIGGNKLDENLGIAKKALAEFGTPELTDLLNESGLGNHPEVIRLLYKAGKAISEDVFVGGNSSQPTERASFYPNSKMN